LQDDLGALMQPFALMFGGVLPRGFAPDLVDRALEADIVHLKESIRAIEADLSLFRDVRHLKQCLAGYRIARTDDEEDEGPPPSRTRSGRRRSQW